MHFPYHWKAWYGSLVVRDGSFWVSFFDEGSFSFRHSVGYVCLLQASIHFDSQSVMYGSEFLKLVSMYAIVAWYFPIWNFFSVSLCELRYIFAFGPSSSPSNSKRISTYCLSIRLFCYVFFIAIFSSKILCSLVTRLLVFIGAFSLYVLEKFPFIVLKLLLLLFLEECS